MTQNGSTNPWRAEEDEILIEMIRDGATSSEIAARAGRTRQAVCGRASRLGLKFKGNNCTAPKARKPKQTNVIVLPKRTAVRAPQHAGPFVAPSAPKLRVITTTAQLIADHLAKHGARRFEPGARCDYDTLQYWLAERGIKLSMRNSLYTVTSGLGRPKALDWSGVVQFVDRLRVQEGLLPFRGAA